MFPGHVHNSGWTHDEAMGWRENCLQYKITEMVTNPENLHLTSCLSTVLKLWCEVLGYFSDFLKWHNLFCVPHKFIYLFTFTWRWHSVLSIQYWCSSVAVWWKAALVWPFFDKKWSSFEDASALWHTALLNMTGWYCLWPANMAKVKKKII